MRFHCRICARELPEQSRRHYCDDPACYRPRRSGGWRWHTGRQSDYDGPDELVQPDVIDVLHRELVSTDRRRQGWRRHTATPKGPPKESPI